MIIDRGLVGKRTTAR